MTNEEIEDRLIERALDHLPFFLENGFDGSDEHRARCVALVDIQDFNYAIIKCPTYWRDGEQTDVSVIPCRDADQLRRAAAKYGDAGTKKAILQ